MIKTIIRTLITLWWVGVIAYLVYHWIQGSINFAYIGSLVPVFGVILLLIIVFLMGKSRHTSWSKNKRIMVVWALILTGMTHYGLTDTAYFWGWDITKVRAMIVFFASLFGLFSWSKTEIIKGEYSKKTQIIEV